MLNVYLLLPFRPVIRAQGAVRFDLESKWQLALRSNNSLSREDRWSKMKQIYENTVGQIKGTLNED